MPCAFGTAGEAELRAAAARAPRTDGMDLVSGVTATRAAYHRPATAPGLRIVAFDFGVKATMVRQLAALGTVTVVPAGTSASDVLAPRPRRGLPLQRARRPGRAPGARDVIADLVGPGADLRDLPGPPAARHRAGRHHLQAPLRPPRGEPPGAAPRDGRGRDHEPEPQLRRGRRLDARRRGDPREPQRRRDRGHPSPRAPAFSVQYHPEAAPGPHDARYLFGAFRA